MKNTFTILLLGDGNVGKTTFLKKLHTLTNGTNELNKTPNPSEKSPIPTELQHIFKGNYLDYTVFQQLTNKGPITFNIIDIFGSTNKPFNTQELYKIADAFIIMFDLTNPQSYQSAINTWYKTVENTVITNRTPFSPHPPTIFIGNKNDLLEPPKPNLRWDITIFINNQNKITNSNRFTYVDTSSINNTEFSLNLTLSFLIYSFYGRDAHINDGRIY